MNVYRIVGWVNVAAFVRARSEEEAREKLASRTARLVNLKTSREVEVSLVDFDAPDRPELALSPTGVLEFDSCEDLDLVHKGLGRV